MGQHHHHTSPQELLDARLKRQQQHSAVLAERQRRIEAKTRQKTEIEAAAQAVKDQEAAARAAEVEKAKNQLLEWKRLTDEYNQRIDEKVASGEIPSLNEYQREKLQYEYVAANTSDPQIKEVMGSMSTSVDTRSKYDAEAAARHLRHLQQHKHHPSFASQCFNVFKIVAIGAVAVFAPPLVGTVAPMLASLGAAGTVVGTGIACAGTDAICQKIGVSTGLQKSFSINEVLETGVSVGLGSAAASAGMIPAAMTSAAGGAITQAVEVQMGTRDDLDPLAVAAQGASSIVSSVASQAMPSVNNTVQENFPDAVKTIGSDNVEVVTKGVVNASTNTVIHSAVLNVPMNLEAILMNSMGSVLGTKVGAAINDVINNLNITDAPSTELSEPDESDENKLLVDVSAEANQNLQLPTEQEMHEFTDMLNQTLERMKSEDAILVLNSINEDASNNTAAQSTSVDNMAADTSSDNVEVIPPVIVEAPKTPSNDESFFDTLSDWQKAGLTIGVALGAVALLPEEVGVALLLGLGRIGTALIPGVGPLSEALAADAMAGEAIAGTAAGAAATGFISKAMTKFGLIFSGESRSANIMLSQQAAKNELSTCIHETESIITPEEQLAKALEKSNVYEQLENLKVSSPNAANALGTKLSRLERVQATADKVEILPNGSIRYYDKFRSAQTAGPTSGSRFVTEYDPSTGNLKMWTETYDASGSVNRVHLKNINGIDIDSPHFPPTLRELLDQEFSSNTLRLR